jgi:uncharacterized membrane protein
MQHLTTEQLVAIMCLTCFGCLWLERRLAIFSHVSGVCLTILVAILLSSLGIIPQSHPLYDFFMGPPVPIAIALMIFGIQFKNLVKLPKRTVLVFAFGIFSSITGGVIAAILCAKSLGENAPKLAAQLTASYIGGNENAVAIYHMLGIPAEIFTASFAVDAIVTSIWMVFTILASRSKIVETEVIDVNNRDFDRCSVTLIEIFMSITLGVVAVELSKLISTHLKFIHPLLLMTFVSFAISRTKWVQTLIRPAYLIGTVLFVPFFFSTGAISKIGALAEISPAVAAMPFIIVITHGILIYTFGWAMKIPSSETSLASQSLIGGAGTAIALAQAKQWKSGISIGLILGLIGYAIANFFGVFVFHISKLAISWLGVLS